jgi:sec-independent protein translocase protein TatA
MFSPMDIGILAGVALLVFGPKKFPELGHSLGKGIGNFKKAMSEVNDEISTAMKTEPTKPTPASETAVTLQPAPTLAQTAAPAPVASPADTSQPESPQDKAPTSPA